MVVESHVPEFNDFLKIRFKVFIKVEDGRAAEESILILLLQAGIKHF